MLPNESSHPPTAAPAPPMDRYPTGHWWTDCRFGLALAGGIAVTAYLIQYLPFPPFRVSADSGVVRYPVGAGLVAILLGAGVRNLLPLGPAPSPGCHFIVRRLMPISIALVGAGLNLSVLRSSGTATLVVVLASILIALGAAWLVGRTGRLPQKTTMLLGIGTAICGSSAIVAVAPLIRAPQRDLVLALSAVNVLGLVFMLALPALGSTLGMSPHAYGVWAGTSVHAVPQAVAAGFAFPGGGAGEVATLVKLVRVALLAPLVLLIALAGAQRSGNLRSVRFARLVPWFIWGFLILALLNTWMHTTTLTGNLAGFLSGALGQLNGLGTLLLTLSMAAIGLEVNLREIMGVGGRVLLAGLAVSLALAAGSLVLIHLLI